jgi:hypothetical protein
MRFRTAYLLTIVDIQNAAPVINCYGLDYYKILLSTCCSDLGLNLSKLVIQDMHKTALIARYSHVLEMMYLSSSLSLNLTKPDI